MAIDDVLQRGIALNEQFAGGPVTQLGEREVAAGAGGALAADLAMPPHRDIWIAQLQLAQQRAQRVELRGFRGVLVGADASIAKLRRWPRKSNWSVNCR